MKLKILNSLVVILLSFVWISTEPVAAVLDKPIITGKISGTWEDGQIVTISGNNFGIKSTPTPVLWDDFDAGNLPSSAGAPQFSGEGRKAQAVIGTSYWFCEDTWNFNQNSSSPQRSGSAYNWQHVYSGSNWDAGIGLLDDSGNNYPWIHTEGEKGFLDFWFYFAQGAESALGNMKIFKVMDYNAKQYEFVVAIHGSAGFIQGLWGVTRNDCGTHEEYEDIGWSPYPEMGAWHHFQLQWKYNTGNNANGDIKIWRNGALVYSRTNSVILLCPLTNNFNRLTAGGHVSGGPWGNNITIYWDDVYIDNSWARVEIGDNVNYDACTHRETQIISAWSDNEITMTINQGSFHDSDTLYLFAVDNNGNVSDGYPFIIGGTTSMYGNLDGDGSQIQNEEFQLSQNYPNPFNPATTIKYSIPAGVNSESLPNGRQTSIVNLKIYDMLGKEVATLVDEQQRPGIYEVTWDASNLYSGVYFYQLRAGNFIQVKKLILMK